ncbi:abortive infection family protein [Xanthomonas axonopodis]|uniref:abortive infection family protein n=1 Tax=Xanthomonas axonopodis TaxID=53413 RepID=UPI003558D856
MRVLSVYVTLGVSIDSLNPARNHGSLAHPNEALLENDEAVLVINAARAIFQYLDKKFAK